MPSERTADPTTIASVACMLSLRTKGHQSLLTPLLESSRARGARVSARNYYRVSPLHAFEKKGVLPASMSPKAKDRYVIESIL